MVSAVAVKPCCAEFNTHAHERTDKHTCRLNDPGPLIRPIPCHISADYFLFDRSLPTTSFIFTGFLVLLGPAAAVGTRQVATGLNEPKLSPLVKCSHLTHLEPGGTECCTATVAQLLDSQFFSSFISLYRVHKNFAFSKNNAPFSSVGTVNISLPPVQEPHQITSSPVSTRYEEDDKLLIAGVGRERCRTDDVCSADSDHFARVTRRVKQV
ncbi:hypothetical protein D9C73_012300 [Collichthys lucidus]|uniref:Uncharacterized protein n=1 Tax=Collichthys lucidus TaxID=240159 RepID=A0A4U5UUN6_COLLU|nr:hypothetical protein D9C73_012300 [Collichthys lucidus]